jgi:hypothetical protein
MPRKKMRDLPSNKKECIWDIAEYTVEPTQKMGYVMGIMIVQQDIL